MWKRIEQNACISFIGEFEDDILHIIKSGSENLYVVVHDDAYGLATGKTELLDAGQIEEKYKILIK